MVADDFGNLDPRVVDTIIAEAGNNVAGQRAVAAAIINRAKAQGKTPLQIVQQHGQFEGYSNPGSASVKAQQIASVRQNATKAFNDVLTGAVADPLKGGKDFRADASAGGLHAPHGTVSIGGNTFALGNAPSSAVAAIDAVAPVPRSIPTSLSAYADTPAVALPPLPVPRPNYPTGGSATLLPFAGGLTAQPQGAGDSWGPDGKRWGPANFANAFPPSIPTPFVSEDHPRSNAAPLAAGMVERGNIDLNNRPVFFGNDGTYGTEYSFSIGTDKGETLIPSIYDGVKHSQQDAIQHYLQTGENMGTFSSVAAADAYAQKTHNRDQGLGNMPVPMPGRPAALNAPSIPQALTSRSVHTVQIDPFTGNPVGSNTPFVSADHPLSNAVPAPASPKTIYYNSTAGNVALPKGVVPASVTRDLASIAGSQMNRSGSPDDRQAPVPQIAPTPMPARPSALNAPYIPGPNGFTVANKDASQLGGGSPSLPFAYGEPAPTAPSVAAIQSVLKPTTTYSYKQMQESNPLYEKYIAAQGADDIGAGPGSFADLQNALAPSRYITKSVRVPTTTYTRVPLPQPRPAIPQPRATGGLLGLLFPGTNPAALSMIGQGLGGGFGVPSAPLPAPGASFLAARDVPTAGLNISQMANELNKQMAGSSRNADGSRGFGVA